MPLEARDVVGHRIVAVNGTAAGGGFSLAISGDLVIADRGYALDVAGFPGEAVMRWAERGYIAG